MIPYHMARCPNYGWKESPEYGRAEELKEKIAGIGTRKNRALKPSLSALQSRPINEASSLLIVFPLFTKPAEEKAKKRWESNFV